MTAEEIVRALAAVEDCGVADRDYNSGGCPLCGAGDKEYEYHMHEESAHKPTCPWRLAREWVRSATSEERADD